MKWSCFFILFDGIKVTEPVVPDSVDDVHVVLVVHVVGLIIVIWSLTIKCWIFVVEFFKLLITEKIWLNCRWMWISIQNSTRSTWKQQNFLLLKIYNSSKAAILIWTVFRIRDILIGIRNPDPWARILGYGSGSGSGSGSCSSHKRLSWCRQKKCFVSKVCAYFLLKVY